MTALFTPFPDPQAIGEIAFSGGDLEVEAITLGAAIRSVRLKDHPTPLVLGYEDASRYARDTAHLGAVAGPVANRIRDGDLVIDQRTHQLDRNENDRHHLHGGRQGFGRRQWTITASGADFVSFKLVTQPGHMGYPGLVAATCTYRALPPATLRIEFGAAADSPTAINLTHHGYFNLDGSDDIGGHRLRVAAADYTDVDADLIPTGAVLPVADGPYDFRQERTIRPASGSPFAYDMNFCLDPEVRNLQAAAACLKSPTGDVSMEVWTTEPGLQFYDGSGLDAPGFGPRAGLCLEPQRWPDATHHDAFPSIMLRPGEPYAHVTEYRFLRR